MQGTGSVPASRPVPGKLLAAKRAEKQLLLDEEARKAQEKADLEQLRMKAAESDVLRIQLNEALVLGEQREKDLVALISLKASLAKQSGKTQPELQTTGPRRPSALETEAPFRSRSQELPDSTFGERPAMSPLWLPATTTQTISRVSLVNCELNDAALCALLRAMQSPLQSLVIENCRCLESTKTLFEGLGDQAANLTELKLCNSFVVHRGDAATREFARLTGIESLWLCNHAINHEGLKHLPKSCKRLRLDAICDLNSFQFAIVISFIASNRKQEDGILDITVELAKETCLGANGDSDDGDGSESNVEVDGPVRKKQKKSTGVIRKKPKIWPEAERQHLQQQAKHLGITLSIESSEL